MNPGKILVVKLRALGDSVLLTAPLLAIRESFPDAEVHVVATKNWAPVFKNHPGVDRIWPYQRHRGSLLRAKTAASIGFHLRKERFDWALNFHASPSSAALVYASGAKVRSIHFHGHRSRNRFSTVTVPGKGILKPIIERDQDTIRALGLPVPERQLPRVFLQPTEITRAAERMERIGLRRPWLGLGLGASRRSKSWQTERFAALAVTWCLRENGSVISFTGQDEMDLVRSFLHAVDDLLSAQTPDLKQRGELRSRIVTETQLDVRELAASLSLLSVFMCNDSGPRHLAVAVQTPTVTVFGPEHPFEWHPYPKDVHPYLFIENLKCRKDALPGYPAWCAVDHCIKEQHQCMKMVGIEAVMEECKRVARR